MEDPRSGGALVACSRAVENVLDEQPLHGVSLESLGNHCPSCAALLGTQVRVLHQLADAFSHLCRITQRNKCSGAPIVDRVTGPGDIPPHHRHF